MRPSPRDQPRVGGVRRDGRVGLDQVCEEVQRCISSPRPDEGAAPARSARPRPTRRGLLRRAQQLVLERTEGADEGRALGGAQRVLHDPALSRTHSIAALSGRSMS
jgi:hypothetical protein